MTKITDQTKLKKGDRIVVKDGVQWQGKNLSKMRGVIQRISGYTYINIPGVGEDIPLLRYEFELD